MRTAIILFDLIGHRAIDRSQKVDTTVKQVPEEHRRRGLLKKQGTKDENDVEMEEDIGGSPKDINLDRANLVGHFDNKISNVPRHSNDK
jgi:hypothetical protein